jgi:CubicO group peptidase (beta-lactamase class C family)
VWSQGKWKFPDSPTGRALTALFETIEAGDSARTREFIDGYFDSAFIAAFSLQGHLDVLQQIHDELGSLELVSLSKPDDYSVMAGVRGSRSPEVVLIGMYLSEAPPHKIVGIDLMPVEDDTPIPEELPEQDDADAVIRGNLGTRLDTLLMQQVLEGFSGSVRVAMYGQTVLHRGYGYANREDRIPVTTRTVFDVASYAKSFTMAAILMLEQQGKLETDDRITRYFDNVPAEKREITIDHLLGMRSGLHEYHDTTGDFEIMSREEAIRRILSQELRFMPGEDRGYSNSGYTLLAMIIEKVSGRPYAEFLRVQLFEPAGLEHTGYYQDPRWSEGQVAYGYDARKFGDRNSPRHWPQITWACSGNGCLVSSPGDLGRWLNALMAGRVLSMKAQSKMYTVYMKPEPTTWGGLVLATAEANDFGFTTATYEFPESQGYVIVTSNTGRIRAPDMADKLVRMIFDR